MSDGMSEAARDQAIAAAYGVLALRVRQYLLKKNARTKNLVIAAAEAIDRVYGGYSTRTMSAADLIEQKLLRLDGGDKTEWMRFLYEWSTHDDAVLEGARKLYKPGRWYPAWERWTSDALYKKFLAMSPFRPTSVFMFSGACGTQTHLKKVSPDVWKMFMKKLAVLGWRANDPEDTYAIVVNGELTPKNMEIVLVYGYLRDPSVHQ